MQNTIDYQNIPFTKITIKTDLNYTNSLVPSEGIYDSTYRIGDTFSLSFEEKQNYNFLNWVIEPADSLEYINCRKGNHTVTLKVNSSEDITVYPLCVEKNKLGINFVGEHGTVSPADQKDYYICDEFNIDFSEDEDYSFLEWQVFDSTGKKIDDYSEIIVIEQPENPRTKVTVYKTETYITIKPKVCKRPLIVTATPVYSSNGVFLDRTLLITFDEEIDKSSIYYSNQEMEELKRSGYSLITDAERGNRCYGYIEEKGQIIYKNIEIKHYGADNENYLKYYGAPYFDKDNKNILRIPVNKQLLPPKDTDILVTIKKGVCYKNLDSNTLVHLRNDFNYIYKTGSTTDNKNPSFGRYDDNEDDFVVRIIPENESSSVENYTKDWKFLYDSLSGVTPDNLSFYTTNSGKFFVRGIILDGGSGLSSLDWSITMLKDISPYYPDYVPYTYSENMWTYSQEGTEIAKINQVIDVAKLNLAKGFYKLNIVLYDSSENIEEFKTLYFLYDTDSTKVVSFESDAYKPRYGSEIEYFLNLNFESDEKLKQIDFSCNGKELHYCFDINELYVHDENGATIKDISRSTEDQSDPYPDLQFKKWNDKTKEYDIIIRNFELRVDLKDLFTPVNNETYTINVKCTNITGIENSTAIKGKFYTEYENNSGVLGFVIDGKQGSVVVSDKTDENGNLIINGVAIPYSSEVVVIPIGVVHSEGIYPQMEGERIDYSYAMGQYPVTWELYNAVMGTTLSPEENQFEGIAKENPVTNITYAEAEEFCKKLSELLGLESAGYYRLPNNLEWEFAKKGGDPRLEDWDYSYSGSNAFDEVGWFESNSNGTTHQVGQKFPNRLNIYDMSGNVWEWTPYYGDGKGVCGGSYFSPENDTSYKSKNPNEKDIYTGFRIVRPYY